MSRRAVTWVLISTAGVFIAVFIARRYDAPPTPSATPTASPSASATTPPTLPSRATGSITVRVTSGGAPCDAVVRLRSDSDVKLQAQVTGNHRFDDLDVGSWKVEADHLGTIGSASAVVKEAEITRVTIDLVPLFVLTGTVRDAEGRPVVNARVTVHPIESGLAATTDLQGNYSISGMPPGTYEITAHHERFRPSTQKDIALPMAAPKNVVDFTLLSGTRISGIVLDDQGRPVPRARIMISNEVARIVTSDEGGKFEASGLGDGKATVGVIAAGFANHAVRDVSPNDMLEIRLMRGCMLKGEIKTAGRFTVTLWRVDPESQKRSVIKSEAFGVGAKGAFQLKEISVGAFELSIEAGGSRTKTPVPVTFQLPGQLIDLGLLPLDPP